MVRVSKSPEDRKQEIIETALALFSEKGYEHTAIQDIAERMNVAQGLCYRYFKSKKEIFAASSDYYAQQAVEHMIRSIDKNSAPIDRFNAMIKTLFTYSMKHSEFEAAYKDELEINAERIQRLSVHISDIVIPIIEQGKAEGVFHCNDVPNSVRMLTFGIINLIHYDMPKQGTREHILSFIPTIKVVCEHVLQSRESNIGVGWGEL